ncbi:uncharacterized protein BXZ73DRAFT_86363 [Epithele typhae]|uniref:uncharacterized protein n=1 Tax=Epithele typhae TaxID=378194 RepID=UPI0020073519|nr:uncharacterized protein BXZ73DRAFT_86363 [Epithele typhae]KAH9946187.1 hypothetical protein BXZ73DRAFT_86363 [Epithele typhae]
MYGVYLPDDDEYPMPKGFSLALHRIMIREVSEVTATRPFRELFTEIQNAAKATDDSLVETLIEKIQLVGRRSFFGFFCHRCYVTFSKMSIGGVEEYHKDFIGWLRYDSRRASGPSPGYGPIRRDIITNDYQLFKTKYDKIDYAEPSAYAEFLRGVAIGDSNQKFHESSESGLRQHAMLNLAHMYFLRRETAACRKVSDPRTTFLAGVSLHYNSLLHRLAPLEAGQRPVINEPQPDMHPLEILADVNKLLTFSTMGLYDQYLEDQEGLFIESEQYAQHATFGCSRLARIEEDIVTGFTEVGGDDNTRLIALSIALTTLMQNARQGKYEQAIASLLDSDVWRGLTLPDYNLWASEIWSILALRACRRRQQRQLKEYLGPRRPKMSDHHPREYQWATEPIGSIIRDPLHEVMVMRLCDQSHNCVDHLLNALWHAEYHGRYNLYRTAIVLLADVGLEFGMTKWCRRILDEVMPQIMSENDLEQKAFAQYTLARCTIAEGDSSVASLEQAVPLLTEAAKTYHKLGMHAAQSDVLFLLAVVLHNAGKTADRDQVATMHADTLAMREDVHLQVVEPWIEDVWAVVTEVGAALASR